MKKPNSATSPDHQLTKLPMPSAPLFKVLRRAYGYLRPYWKQTAGAYGSLLLILVINSVIPQFTRWIIDRGIVGKQENVLLWSVIALLALTLIKGVLNYYQGLFTETASQKRCF